MAAPLTAGQLVAALKAEGCTVREVRSWRTSAATKLPFTQSWASPR